MSESRHTQLIDRISHQALSLSGAQFDYNPLLENIGDKEIILIGEASHGTQQFYRERARLTQLLIEQKGFTAVAVEADWPDAYQVNRYVHGSGESLSANDALGGFKRFPTWMWRNTEVLDFITWLREINDQRHMQNRVGFYGLDLYSLYTSIEAVIRYLETISPDAAQQARNRYACFDQFREDMQQYGLATHLGITPPCEKDVVSQLQALQQQQRESLHPKGRSSHEDFFDAWQNARLIQNAEQYYRSMFGGRTESWNLRDQHMMQTLEALVEHLKQKGQTPKVVVWAHNSHIGDARATEMGKWGELNIGQLAREKFTENTYLIGFSTYTGTVTAASSWDSPAERKHVRKGLVNSYEHLLHETGIPAFMLLFSEQAELKKALIGPYLERAIGVIYLPKSERQSHYFSARISEQFDALIFLDETHAVVPLEITAGWEAGEFPETYPYAV